MAKEKPKDRPREMKGKAVVPYKIANGPTWNKFFDGFKEEKILGTKCKRCNRVFVPPRSFCPRCFEDIDEWVEVSQEGIVDSWVYVDYTYYGETIERPIVTCNVRLDGADTDFIHRIAGFDISNFDEVNKKVKLGGKIRAVWSKEKHGDQLDIDYFELVE